MSIKSYRSAYQIGFMFLIVGISAITGWACDCGSGSDHTYTPGELSVHDQAAPVPGVLQRYHDIQVDNAQVDAKDWGYLKEFLQSGEVGIGLLVPTAPGATLPGSLILQNEVHLSFSAGGQWRNFSVPLQQDSALESRLNELYPAPSGAQWQGLTVAGYDWLAQVPTDTTTVSNLWGNLHYYLDFHGEDVCDHCQIQLTVCSSKEFSFGEQAILTALGSGRFVQNADLTCAEPVPTTVLVTDSTGSPQPGTLTASFGFWGGTVYSTTFGADIALPYALSHTAATTQTMELQPVDSAQGWSYHFADMDGNPITQIAVGPLAAPMWSTYGPNIQVIGSGLPTCTRMLDTIYLTATLVTTPTVQANTSTAIQVLPDPNACQVADVGISQVSATSVITAGQWVTFTLTVTNFENSSTSMIVTDTLSSAAAIASAALPAGCTRSGATITCQVNNLGAGQSADLVIAIQTAGTFSGTLTNRAWVEPAAGTDMRFYDNAATPLDVHVSGQSGEKRLFLPLVTR